MNNNTTNPDITPLCNGCQWQEADGVINVCTRPLCEGCYNYVEAPTDEDLDQCLAEPSISDTTQDPNGIIVTCKCYCPYEKK